MAPAQPVEASGQHPPKGSAWAPFESRTFAAMWSAQFISNVGGWMQTVAAQWLMISLTTSATYVALVQTAASLPVVLFSVLAGALGDLVDRRRFLLVTQGLMLLAAAALGVLALEGLVTPLVLLALIFAVGTGAGPHVADVANTAARAGASGRPSASHLSRCGQSEPPPRGRSGVGRRYSRRHQRWDRVPRECVDIPRGHRGAALVAQHAIDAAPAA